MPRFDYQCNACNHVFEFSRPFGSQEEPPCPTCVSKDTRKLITPPSIHFKGSGFYKTDSGIATAKPAADKAEPKKKAADTPKAEPSPPKEQTPSKKDGK